MLGTLIVPRILSSAGYVRVFLSFTGVLAIVVLILGLYQSLFSWLCLRFITGLSVVGIVLAAESWLNASTEPGNRGKTLSVYAVTTLFGMALGQMIVGFIDFEQLFQVCAILLLMSLIPIGLFCNGEPEHPKFYPPSFKDVFVLPRFVTVAIVLHAIMSGSIWSVAPLFGDERGLNSWEIGLMMNAIVLGGAVGQFPIGWLSDKYDKRSILLSVVTLCIVVVSLIFLTDDKMLFLALCFAFGAVSLPIYVLCVSLANEDSSISRVKVASIILMLNGGGSILGPLLVAFIASYFLNALLIVSGLSMLLLLGASVIFKRPQVEALIIELPTSSFEPVLKQTELAA